MLNYGFSKKFPGQGIFGRNKYVNILSWLCFIRCLLLLFLAFSLHFSPTLITHRKIFHVTTTLKIKVILAVAEELTNLRSFKCV